MNIKMIQASVEKLVTENATVLLTAGGVVGTVATGVLAWRGGYKAYGDILEAEVNRNRDHHGDRIDDDTHPMAPMSMKEKAIVFVPHAAPPVVTGGLGIAAIIMSHRMSAQKAAALAAAYGLSRDQFEEYREKVAEKLTGAKKQQIDDELAQDRVDKAPFTQQKVVLVGNGDVLCFDAPGGRYFESSMEKIQQVVNQVNEQILHHDAVDANYFYTELGLPETKWGDQVGWNMDNLVEVDVTTTLTDDQKPCLVVDFKRYPTTDYMDRNYG